MTRRTLTTALLAGGLAAAALAGPAGAAPAAPDTSETGCRNWVAGNAEGEATASVDGTGSLVFRAPLEAPICKKVTYLFTVSSIPVAGEAPISYPVTVERNRLKSTFVYLSQVGPLDPDACVQFSAVTMVGETLVDVAPAPSFDLDGNGVEDEAEICNNGGSPGRSSFV